MKSISLKSGHSILLDDEDYEWINDLYGWKVNNQGYVQLCKTVNKKKHAHLIHHLILRAAGIEISKGYEVDHINGNPLDNRKINLRVCTISQNRQNSAKHMRYGKSMSLYKGVSKQFKGCASRINQTHIGTFENERHAAMAYDLWAIDLYGEFARTNFKVVSHSSI